ncbi:predicted protein [Sclerotinia sclerotiorum 1980 UF-70]|uniref:Uncharacterized protein n=1 Tax=Sclerotinia sclerotiorum (strain ATCC 18683 / 1980 / Ss-1) TaxID=665079 RepID=A7EI61_SCLS1|nr:predicted protein [Sclerotinia sclerotiorum 1980 UF-70]EDO02527.1 predicted protein [Sclerotinia sclerotiorum 1980 UF-70]
MSVSSFGFISNATEADYTNGKTIENFPVGKGAQNTIFNTHDQSLILETPGLYPEICDFESFRLA